MTNSYLSRTHGISRFGHTTHLGESSLYCLARCLKSNLDIDRSSYAGYVYWGGILFLGILSRFIGWIMSSRGHDTEHEIESNTYPLVPKHSAPFWVRSLSYWIETHLYVSTPLGKSQEILTCTFSNRAEALAVAGFWIMSVALSFLAYDAFEGNL